MAPLDPLDFCQQMYIAGHVISCVYRIYLLYIWLNFHLFQLPLILDLLKKRMKKWRKKNYRFPK